MAPGRSTRRVALTFAVVVGLLPVTSVGPAGAATAIVTALTARQSGEGQVKLSWTHTPVAPSAQRLIVYEAGSTNRKVRTVGLSATATSTSVNGLVSGKRYLFQLQTTPKGKASSYVKLVGRPSALKGLRADWYGEDLLVTWKPVADGVLVGVVVSGPDGYRRDFAVSGSTAGVRVTGADPAATYKVTAIASNAAGMSTPVRVSSSTALPATPTVSTTVLSTSSVRVSWVGSAVTWQVRIVSAAGDRDGDILSVPGERSSVEVDRLTPGASYTFKVSPVNSYGSGTAAETTPTRLPLPVSAPVGVTAVAGDSSARVSWSTGNGAPATNWRVTWRPGTSGEWSNPVTTSERNVVVDGLTNGTLHQIRVEALDQLGGAYPAPVVSVVPAAATPTPGPAPQPNPSPTPTTNPIPAATLSVSPGDGVITLSWVGTVTQLLWQPNGETTWSTTAVTGTGATLEGLTNGVLHRIKALDVAGNELAYREATPVGLAQPVRNLEVSPRHSELALSWQLPINDGGVPMVGIRINWRGDAGSGELFAAPTATSATITGLVNGVVYQISLVAVNEMGDSTPVETSGTPAS